MKNLIDYASQDNGTEFRAELYAAIHDKVSAHIDAKKQEIASGLMGQQSEEYEEDLDEEVESLDELSKGTLRRYTKKAIADLGTTNSAMQSVRDNRLSSAGAGQVQHQKAVRTNGINTAAKKLKSEEVEHLDEISADKITDYSEKAQKSYADPKTSDAKKANRKTGLMTGYQKLKARAKVPATYGED